MIGIYKIENTLNHKIYVGQSVHIERRWSEHCFPSKKSVISKLYKNMVKKSLLFKFWKNVQLKNSMKKNLIIPKSYNLPYKTSEIKKINDQEWEQI